MAKRTGPAPYATWPLRFVEKRREYASVHTLSFEPLLPIEFRAGQYVHLAAVESGWTKPLVRHMSIAAAPGSATLDFAMDLGSGSAYKERMAALRPGDRVAAFKLKGEFTVDPARRAPMVFLAGGLGITPIRAILDDLERAELVPERVLVHISRDDHLYAEELSCRDFPQWRTDRAGLDALWPTILNLGGGCGTYYICGSSRFVDGLVERLIGSGVAPEGIMVENFR
jgi:ferredoxin-NADP reductase